MQKQYSSYHKISCYSPVLLEQACEGSSGLWLIISLSSDQRRNMVEFFVQQKAYWLQVFLASVKSFCLWLMIVHDVG